MSLHDVSKDHNRRALPTPNQVDQVNQRMALDTVGFTPVNETSDVPYLSIKRGQAQVYKADGTLLFQFGFRDSDGEGAVDMAKPGQGLT